MRVKVDLAPLPRLLATEPGDTIGGAPIAQTVPGGRHVLVDLPEDWTPTQIEAWAQGLLAAGLLTTDGVLWRPEHTDYKPLGWPEILPADVAALYTVGDTFALQGVTDDVRKRGNWGAKRLGHVDTPVDAAHPFFRGKTLVRANGANPSGPTDAHGTHTITTAAGGEGVSYDAEMYTYPGLIGGTGSESGIAAGIRWCADSGCDVLSLSLGGSPSSIIDDGVNYARQRGVWVVSAAGNSSGNPTPGSPARSSTVIAMACDRSMVHASFTDGMNWSLPHRYFSIGVQVVAGVPGGTTGVMSGTSMSCPTLAGLLLLLRAAGLTEGEMYAYLDAHQVGVN